MNRFRFKHYPVGLLLCCFLPAFAQITPELRLGVLERKVNELERRLQALEATPQPPPRASVRSGDSANIANWRALRKGMTELEVKALLGEPRRVQGGGFTNWYWDRSAKVTFFQDIVYGWDEPQ